jgi:hypothetical protein
MPKPEIPELPEAEAKAESKLGPGPLEQADDQLASVLLDTHRPATRLHSLLRPLTGIYHPCPDSPAPMPDTKRPPNAGTQPPLSPQDIGSLEDSLKHIVDHSQSHENAPARYPEAREERVCRSILTCTTAVDFPTDALHSHGPEARAWISHFFPRQETLNAVRFGI